MGSEEGKLKQTILIRLIEEGNPFFYQTYQNEGNVIYMLIDTPQTQSWRGLCTYTCGRQRVLKSESVDNDNEETKSSDGGSKRITFRGRWNFVFHSQKLPEIDSVWLTPVLQDTRKFEVVRVCSNRKCQSICNTQSTPVSHTYSITVQSCTIGQQILTYTQCSKSWHTCRIPMQHDRDNMTHE